MRRIDGPTAVPDLHGPGKNGFRDGNKPVGILATKLKAEIWNSWQEEKANLIESEEPLDPDDNTQMLRVIEAKIARALRDVYVTQLEEGDPLPTTNIGTIWHPSYNSFMTWQVFNANGANYTGYASILVGSILFETQPTPRAGYVKTGTSNLSRATYPQLRNWALHHGLMVASGVWTVGTLAMCDNPDGMTYKIFDVRAQFPRFWDDSRGLDVGRVFGSGQGDAIRNITGSFLSVDDNAGLNSGAFYENGNTGTGTGGAQNEKIVRFDASRVVPVASENRPLNTVFMGAVKL